MKPGHFIFKVEIIHSFLIFTKLISNNFIELIHYRSYKQEQLSLCVWYVKDMEVNKQFICFMDVSSGRGVSHLPSTILTAVQKYNIHKIPLVAQSYDGANIMSRSITGVQQKIREHYPKALYIHCLAHKLNLVVCNTCNSIKILCDVLFKNNLNIIVFVILFNFKFKFNIGSKTFL